MADMNFQALVSSRICHDLLNPIGAMSNGMEMLALSGIAPSQELDLINQCNRTALARLQFFRLAFGESESKTKIASAEAQSLCRQMFAQPRLSVDWNIEAVSLSRAEAKLIFLLLLCAETSLPQGGKIVLTLGAISGSGQKISAAADLWGHVNGITMSAALRPSQVQFALAGQQLTTLGWGVSTEFHNLNFQIRFGPAPLNAA